MPEETENLDTPMIEVRFVAEKWLIESVVSALADRGLVMRERNRYKASRILGIAAHIRTFIEKDNA
jgi:hypothetical protein